MPRLAVIVAGLCILAAGLYGGLRGFDFTDLDTTPAQTVADTVVRPAATEPLPTPASTDLDERAVREIARAEVRQLIPPPPPRPRAPAPQAAPLVESSPESPSTEAVEPEDEADRSGQDG